MEKKIDHKANADSKPWVTDSEAEHIRQGKWLDSWRGILLSGSLYLLFCLVPLWYLIGFVFRFTAEIFSIPFVENWLPYVQPICLLIAIIFGPFYVAARRYVDNILFEFYKDDTGTLYGYLINKKSDLLRILLLGLLMWLTLWFFNRSELIWL